MSNSLGQKKVQQPFFKNIKCHCPAILHLQASFVRKIFDPVTLKKTFCHREVRKKDKAFKYEYIIFKAVKIQFFSIWKDFNKPDPFQRACNNKVWHQSVIRFCQINSQTLCFKGFLFWNCNFYDLQHFIRPFDEFLRILNKFSREEQKICFRFHQSPRQCKIIVFPFFGFLPKTWLTCSSLLPFHFHWQTKQLVERCAFLLSTSKWVFKMENFCHISYFHVVD